MYRNVVPYFRGKVNHQFLSAIKCGHLTKVVSCYHTEGVFGYRTKVGSKYEGSLLQ